MCGRYTYLLTWGEIIQLYGLTGGGGSQGDGAAPPEPAEFRKRYNQAPTELAPVVRIKPGHRREAPPRVGDAPMGLGQDEERQGVDQRPVRGDRDQWRLRAELSPAALPDSRQRILRMAQDAKRSQGTPLESA